MTDQHIDTAEMAEVPGYAPVKVHVVADSTRQATPASPPRMAGMYLTIVLTSAAPVRNLIGTDPNREYILAQASGNDVVLCATKAQALDAYNEATGLPNPDGLLLPKANTAPSPLKTTEALWAAAAAYPALVSLAVFTRGT